eukprot:1137209-Pelagomonas_calceolata.AAC.1
MGRPWAVLLMTHIFHFTSHSSLRFRLPSQQLFATKLAGGLMLQAGKQALLATSFLTRAAQQRPTTCAPENQTPGVLLHVAGPSAYLARYATVDSTADTHDDFKTVYKSGQGKPAQDAMSQIKQDVEGHDVFIYMKGEPDAPMCGFSNMACRVLNHYGECSVLG